MYLINSYAYCVLAAILTSIFLQTSGPLVVAIFASVAVYISSTIPIVPKKVMRLQNRPEKHSYTISPSWEMKISQQMMYKPSHGRIIEPLKAREKFIQYWARDADYYSTNDRNLVPVL